MKMIYIVSIINIILYNKYIIFNFINNMCLDEYHITYPEYFNEHGNIHKKYVYGSVHNWIIVYEKVFFTKTDEKRQNIYDHNFATYWASKLKVIAIIDKFVCSITTEFIQFNHFNEQLKLKVKCTTRPTKKWLPYYKSYEVAHYQNIPYFERTIPYIGKHKSWYDNGRISSEGEYYKNEKQGEWKYWYNTFDISKPNEISCIIKYYDGNIIDYNKKVSGFGEIKLQKSVQK